jgi:hypothetical protein
VKGGDKAEQYSDKWLILCYSVGVCSQFDTQKFRMMNLKVIDFGLSFFNQTRCTLISSMGRNGTLVYNGKEQWSANLNWTKLPLPDMFPHPVSKLSRELSPRQRYDKYCKSQYCVSNDMASWVSVEAAMAGCVSVILPQPNVTKEEWLNTAYGQEELKYGIAFGVDELEHAELTKPIVHSNLLRQEKKQISRIKKFMRDAYAAFNFNASDFMI